MIILVCPKCKSSELYIANEVKTEYGQYSVFISCGNCGLELNNIVRLEPKKNPIYTEKL